MATGSEAGLREIPWLRTAAEVVTIVASILLAFAIDAWWQERGERVEEQRALVQLAQEFEATRTELTGYIGHNRQIGENLAHADSLIQGGMAGNRRTVTVPVTVLSWLLTQGTFAPTLATLDGLRTSGRLTIIRNAELREALAAWPGDLEDAVEDQTTSREFMLEHLYPPLSQSMNLGPVSEGIRSRMAGQGGEGAMREVELSRPLAGAVSYRALLVDVTIGEFLGLREQIDRILELLGDDGDDASSATDPG